MLLTLIWNLILPLPAAQWADMLVLKLLIETLERLREADFEKLKSEPLWELWGRLHTNSAGSSGESIPSGNSQSDDWKLRRRVRCGSHCWYSEEDEPQQTCRHVEEKIRRCWLVLFLNISYMFVFFYVSILIVCICIFVSAAKRSPPPSPWSSCWDAAPPAAPAGMTAQHGSVIIALNVTSGTTGPWNITINK